MDIFNIILVHPITNILVAFYQGLLFLHVPYPLGFSIILLTLAIRFVLLPFTAAQLRTSKKMQTLNPHISKLKEKHKGDAKMLQAETMKLYKEHGVNPAAGCVPALIQLPIIFALYGVLRQIVDAKTVLTSINKVLYFPSLRLHSMWDTHFFGLSLAATPSKMIAHYGFLILLIPVVTALLQMFQSKMMFSTQKPVESETAVALKDGEKPKKSTSDDFASAMQTQSIYIIPLVIGYSSFSFPLGLSLYWNTFTIFGIIQQYYMNGWGGLQEWIDKARGKTN
ncbi:MAG TPA: YidC/Oxa1 family membrane protein insertase [Candidatus Saccharimonadales bacterium]|nr:YidC/Oxa1 family membrane protein insertase [Candidatus Saccharimonadales bacterium]